MASSEELVQRAVHQLEMGKFAVWLKRSLLGLIVVAIGLLYMYHFRGLATSQAMDQAQIGRAIASGHGWRTDFIRPRAIGQLQAHGKSVPQKIWSDTYNAPLPPLVDAIALFPLRGHWKMTLSTFVYSGDKAIAILSISIFFASVGVLFFIARRLFDQRLALMTCGFVLLCDMIWQYSLSGLPQMLLLLLFNLTIYALLRAVEEKHRGGASGLWLIAVGIGFGFLALSHALTVWIFVAAFACSLVFFRPRGRVAIVMLSAFAVIYLPWLLRNFMVCGNPGGVAIYSILDGLGPSEAGWMRRIPVGLQGISTGALRDKFLTNLMSQSGHLVAYFGFNVVALMFFPALLHRFKRPETDTVRWMLFFMWIGTVAGMATYGIHEEQGVAANQLHLLFIPIMTGYGLAYLLVQWRRLGIGFPIARTVFVTLLYLICAGPMIFDFLFLQSRSAVRWPPYMPPYISILNNWMKPQEIVASDMPWAVAWYADRASIWLPETIKTMTDLSDYNILGGPINGLYLTPISGAENTYRDITKGEYRDWAPAIQHTVVLENFPLKWATVDVGLDGECTFFSDHDREHAGFQ
ncbi:MAG TPA: glycosyltransferase family 39 protein [Chthoniobacterales bacterium]|nr:glycosyltransferase family 39 protein [Chthoniobacterales bacterium]